MKRGTGILGCVIFVTAFAACNNNKNSMLYKDVQLTSDQAGHVIHNTQVFSPDDEWIVFDSRNNENAIGSTS
ncbi:MAG TPA: hypothetical protein PL085_20125, partial [Agriterribacter sp.]|nr:hypothetical protein [Agriterribacter sp.]